MPFGLEELTPNCDVIVHIVNEVITVKFNSNPSGEIKKQFDDIHKSLLGWRVFYHDYPIRFEVCPPNTICLDSAAERIALGLEESGLKVQRISEEQKKVQSFIIG
jgi:hypothetical protein